MLFSLPSYRNAIEGTEMGKGLFWCIVAIILLAGFLPVPASAAPNDAASPDHHVAVRQAHLAWVSLERDAEMNAALTYVGTRYNTDTAKMTGLLADFRNAEARIPAAATDADVDRIIADLRNSTRQFQNEVRAQMGAGQGSWDELNRQITQATSNNPYVEEKKNLYWSTRIKGQLSDFDTWAGDAQAELDDLSAKGYDTAKAQRALDVTIAKRPDLKSALEFKDENKINDASDQILSLSSAYADRVGEVEQQVPNGARIRFLLEQADRAVGKADRLNTDTTVVILDIGAADPALSRLKNDIQATRLLLNAGRLETADKNMLIVKKDFTDLAQAYRDIANSANLPPDLSGALSTMAITLDNTASQMVGS
jgi:hypothetical protein